MKIRATLDHIQSRRHLTQRDDTPISASIDAYQPGVQNRPIVEVIYFPTSQRIAVATRWSDGRFTTTYLGTVDDDGRVTPDPEA